MQHELLFMTEGTAYMGPVNRDTNTQLRCLAFSNSMLADLEVFTKSKSYTSFRVYKRIVALAIPDKPLHDILNAFYPQLKKDIIAKVNNRHREMKIILEEVT